MAARKAWRHRGAPCRLGKPALLFYARKASGIPAEKFDIRTKGTTQLKVAGNVLSGGVVPAASCPTATCRGILHDVLLSEAKNARHASGNAAMCRGIVYLCPPQQGCLQTVSGIHKVCPYTLLQEVKLPSLHTPHCLSLRPATFGFHTPQIADTLCSFCSYVKKLPTVPSVLMSNPPASCCPSPLFPKKDKKVGQKRAG